MALIYGISHVLLMTSFLEFGLLNQVGNASLSSVGHLRPSRELLEYYRQKIAEYDGEYDKLLKKLEKYKCTYEQVVRLYISILL